MEYKYDVFISYSSKDQKIVEGMCHYLEERNLRCFVAYRDVPKGGYWGKYISPAIKKSKVFIYVHTSTANESEDTTREIVLALKCKLIVIPFRVEDIEYRDDKEYNLTNLNWLDAFPEEPESYFGNLYDIVKVNFPEREIKNKDDKSNEATVESESIKCPHCSGEHNIGATFCENTGKKLKNACTNKSCSEYNKYVLPGNAKFCLICGQPIVNDTDKLEQKCKQLNNEIEHLKSKISLLEKEKQEKCTECKNKQQEELKNQQQRFAEQEEKYKNEISSLKKELKSRIDEIEKLKEKEITNSFTINGVSFTMILVQGGTYQMGTFPDDIDAYDDERPCHIETVGNFMIGETQVTQELWQAVMGNNPSSYIGDMQRPVDHVSWDDCHVFIGKLNELTGWNFRLPTEAEWEYAARGGNRSKGYKYSGSNEADAVAWYKDNSDLTTHHVKTKQPNELGIYDMSGNVWEWCQDKWYDDYDSPRNSIDRVLRGGSLDSSLRSVRVPCRLHFCPDYRININGLRLAL